MNWVTRSGHLLWAIMAWLAFSLAALFALLVTILVPGQHRRQRLAALAAKSIFVLARVDVEVVGIDELPGKDCVIVANHASYIDGFLLKGYLPARFNFVIKGEMRDIPVVHFLLRRCGAKFVERNSHAGSARDARQIVKAAKDGESLAFFPEGTFRKEPGVGRFRPGAFVAAVRGQLAVVPIAISGTRKMLPAGRMMPWPNALKIRVLPPIVPDHPQYSESRALAETARQAILGALDEPDLLQDAGESKEPASN